MKDVRPPQRITRLLESVCPEYLFEGIIGDLEEQFYDDLETFGEKRAKRRYWWNTVRFVRPEILLRNNSKFSIINTIMISNYIKTAGRNMAKRKMFSFINAFGLSIGIAFCILIFLYIKDEKSFDKFHSNSHKIYRVEEKAYDTWDPNPEEPYNYSAYLQTGLGPVLKEEVPQVQYASRFSGGGSAIVANGDKVFTEDIDYVDPDFFKMFSFKVLAGNSDEFLTDKYHAILTPDMAEKYFESQDVLGKTLSIDIMGEQEFTVVGLIEEAPANSSLNYNIIVSQTTRPYYDRNIDSWGNFNTPTFIQLVDNADMTAVNESLGKIVDKYMAESLERRQERTEIPEGFTVFEYQLTALEDMHLNTQVTWSRSSDPKYSMILGGIALLILLIACINYISLSLTASAARQTEVGVRKSVGAQRGQLINQFAFESVILAFLSMVIGIALMFTFLPAFNEFTNKDLSFDAITILQVTGIGVGLAVLVGLISGFYPAFYLSAAKPTQVLKGGFTTKMKAGFTKPLVVLQFALSAFLIISSVIMYQQMEYITTKDLGYDQEQVIVVPTQMGWNEESNKAVERMRTRLSQESFVTGVAGTSLSFNQGYSRYGYEIDDENKSAYVFAVDAQYIEVLGIEMAEGRNFLIEGVNDSTDIVVNEALVADMGWENPLEEHLNWRQDSTSLGSKVVGVVKDYHFLSLERTIEPMFLSMDKKEVGYLQQMLIKIKPGELNNAVDKLQGIWNELSPDKPFDYTFMDEDIARQYASYERWMSIMGLATLFAILISCLGLFGLAGINAINRTKEMGIRKVFGAEVMNIFVLLNRQYIWLALIAFVIASPLSWYAMNIWLEDFEYGIEISWPIFAISMGLGLLIALVTVSYHAVKSAYLSPAETLKYE
ncbi:ABC transporter permease [Fulvivirga lutimaris]|uniref:ABC transporter permease n=1 Tax=Fulvivirga lutimaris TaxID=1819566 RepID=UPI0012BB8F95|nr:ABC transporter permease [Fulvivirga lutimaris]MTI39293.1 ABC transporter permease [Fulvivirga lutimaris]